jgi:hypothetical protein
LQPFSFTAEKLQHLEQLMDENVLVIVEAHVRGHVTFTNFAHTKQQFEKMLKECGLASVIALVDEPHGEVRQGVVGAISS